MLLTEAPPALLMGPALASAGSVVEPAGTGCVQCGRSPWSHRSHLCIPPPQTQPKPQTQYSSLRSYSSFSDMWEKFQHCINLVHQFGWFQHWLLWKSKSLKLKLKHLRGIVTVTDLIYSIWFHVIAQENKPTWSFKVALKMIYICMYKFNSTHSRLFRNEVFHFLNKRPKSRAMFVPDDNFSEDTGKVVFTAMPFLMLPALRKIQIRLFFFCYCHPFFYQALTILV